MLGIYAVTMLLSAALIFAVQPMVAKMLLPALGGSTAVWTTCMLFFQALLLGGYAYAHIGARLLRPRRQALVHIVLMVVATIVLPLSVAQGGYDSTMSPISWLLFELMIGVGLPYFVLASTAPMLQHWFAQTDHIDAADPYHLYAASNLGSMAALVGYPFLLEPWAGVKAQSVGWSICFGMLILAAAGCAVILHRRGREYVASHRESVEPLGWKTRAYWVVMAFIPSSLMLGVTQYLTTDIASVPLLWVVPLALYLLTFILVFSKYEMPVRLPLMALPWLVVALVLMDVDLWLEVPIHLGLFFALAMFYHGRLAKARPSTDHLTEYYLLMSAGGALGGLFNALIAPVVFDRLVEYFVVLALAVALFPSSEDDIDPDDELAEMRPDPLRIVRPVAIALVGFVFLGFAVDFLDIHKWQQMAIGLSAVGIAGAVAFFFPRYANVGLAAVFCVGVVHDFTTPGVLAYKRSFYAAYRVFERTNDGIHTRRVSHGTTSHGAQVIDEGFEDLPVAYYHTSGPVGQAIKAIPHQRMAFVGLGVGTLASYCSTPVKCDFFEIDPMMESIAREWFTYLEQCGDACTVEIGDGRRLLEARPDGTYDIIVLDAYNSDSIPMHLLTREAMQIYMKKLSPNGVLVLHLSNRYLRIQDVAGALVKDLGLQARTQLHIPTKEDKKYYVLASRYTIVARDEADFGELAVSDDWSESPASDIIWTDDYSNIIDVIDWD